MDHPRIFVTAAGSTAPTPLVVELADRLGRFGRKAHVVPWTGDNDTTTHEPLAVVCCVRGRLADRLEDVEAARLDTFVDEQLVGAMRTAKQAVGRFDADTYGRLIYVVAPPGTSRSAHDADENGLATGVAAGIAALVRTLAREVARDAVTVNVVSIGTTPHPALAAARLDAAAAVVDHLAAHGSGFITGQVIDVDATIAAGGPRP